jgi:hypothetical protein
MMNSAREYLVKSALDKQAKVPWLPLLAGGALGAYAIPKLYKYLMGGDPQAPEVQNEVDMDPAHQQIRRMALYNQSLSRDLQGAKGAFGAAQSPM